MKDGYYIFNLETQKTSKKSWKTYNGALKNCSLLEIVSSLAGIDWILRHPDWIETRKNKI